MLLTRLPSACAAVVRISGEGSRIEVLRIGSRSPRYGDTSLGSETRLHMLPTMVAAFFLRSVLRVRRPRCTTGTSSASDGASTAFTNVVSITTSRALAVLSGSERDSRRMGAMARISGFLITWPTWASAALAPSRTLTCESETAAAMTGTMVGRQVPSWRGAQYAMAPSRSTAAAFVRHARSSTPWRSAGMTSLTPCPDSWLMTALAAASAASRTPGSLSPHELSRMGRM
mmetsp:Transcript_39032/g.79910  ORF Transcript_39032/g.79910 Transcript_39032/m.79910 type:complete len:230 (+) Transcript_39032:3216-3905(+)